MAYREHTTAARLRERLDYDPDTGIFIWRERPESDFASLRTYRIWRTRYCRKPAGTLSGEYININVDGLIYRAHRLAWLHFYGEWPATDLDHRDGHKANNRIRNLRLTTDSQNAGNARLSTGNTSGFKGVSYSRNARRWVAQIKCGDQQRYLGLFDTPEAAHAAYVKAAAELFGEFARG